LAIWRDLNGNGVSEPGEVKTLGEWGVVALRCRADAGPADPLCAAQASKGVLFRDGTSRPTFDVVLRQRSKDCKLILRTGYAIPKFSF